jgi:flagellar motor switch protein FliG
MPPEKGKGLTYFSGLRKAAVLLIGLGAKSAATILRELNDSEIELLIREMSVLENIPSEVINDIAQEFADMIMAHKYLASGGIDYAKEVLVEALDTNQAMKIIERVRRSTDLADLDSLETQHPEQFFNLLSEEHPQTIAFILSQLSHEKAGNLFSKLDENVRNDVILRLATMSTIDTSLASEVAKGLSSSLDMRVVHEKVGGEDKTASILNHTGQTITESALKALSELSPEVAKEIEKRMYTFELILRLEDKDVQRILKDLDFKELAMALKVARPELKNRLFENLSERAKAMLEEEISYLSKVRLRDVEGAQLKIAMAIKALVESGEIVLPTAEEGDVYV